MTSQYSNQNQKPKIKLPSDFSELRLLEQWKMLGSKRSNINDDTLAKKIEMKSLKISQKDLDFTQILQEVIQYEEDEGEFLLKKC